MRSFPTHVVIREVGLRDGLQSIQAVLPTARKLEWIAGAYAAKSCTTLHGRSVIRSAAAAALLVLALLTAGGPWLAAVSGIHSMGWLPFDCSTH